MFLGSQKKWKKRRSKRYQCETQKSKKEIETGTRDIKMQEKNKEKKNASCNISKKYLRNMKSNIKKPSTKK